MRTKKGAGPTLGVVRRKETCCETPGGEAPGASRCRDWAAAQSPELRAAAAASGRHRPSPWSRQRPQLGEQAPPRDDCAAPPPRAPPRPAPSPCVPRAGGLARPPPAASALLGAHGRSPRAARGTSPAPPSPRGEGARRPRTFPGNPPGAGDVCRLLRWARRGRAGQVLGVGVTARGWGWRAPEGPARRRAGRLRTVLPEPPRTHPFQVALRPSGVHSFSQNRRRVRSGTGDALPVKSSAETLSSTTWHSSAER